MFKQFFISIFLLSLLTNPFTIVSQVDDGPGWKLAKEKNGIVIFTRQMEGSKFKEYKTITVVEATPQELIDILLDVENYPKWMAFVKAAELLEMDGENIFYVYSEVKLPWPFDNRDEVTKSVVKKDSLSNNYHIEIDIIEDYVPEKKGITRLVFGNGLWVFTPVDEHKTEVYHRFGGDPGGKIPAWIVNMFLVDGPYKTMMGLQELALKKSN